MSTVATEVPVKLNERWAEMAVLAACKSTCSKSRRGAVLYATCSIERLENQTQAKALVRLSGGAMVKEKLTLPGGSGAGYYDGGYHALVATSV